MFLYQPAELPTESAILLETLSVEPRVFRLSNFISLEEADLLVAGAQGKLRDASLPPRGTSATTGAHSSCDCVDIDYFASAKCVVS